MTTDGVDNETASMSRTRYRTSGSGADGLID
jgi:hypothetical protein